MALFEKGVRASREVFGASARMRAIMRVEDAAAHLRDEVDEFPEEGKVAYAYNPLRYAWAPHLDYIQKYGVKPRRVILVGMNPGPWGMGQTGVPFGDVKKVRDWMGVRGEVKTPLRLHPKRPIDGFACRRSEPSGTRLYSWAEARYGSASAFFDEFFVVNYCPILMFDEAGKNLTPADLPVAQKRAIVAMCDPHLARVIEALSPQFVVGVGGYATEQAQRVVSENKLEAIVGTVLHPSPASPRANRGWAEQAEQDLRNLGVL